MNLTMPGLTDPDKLARLRTALEGKGADPKWTLAEHREAHESGAARLDLAPDVRIRPLADTAVPIEVYEPDGGDAAYDIVFMPGGGYVMGSLVTARPIGTHLAARCRARVFSVGYRLAPEHPFPAALEDAVSAYTDVMAGWGTPDAVVGDSAGGGLVIVLLAALRDRGIGLPAAAACLSPWTDLSLRSPSLVDNAGRDPMVRKWMLRWMAEQYLGDGQPSRAASAVDADLTGLPPLLLQAGERELLRDDATRLAELARAQGVPVRLEIWQDMFHIWHSFAPRLAEARAAYRSMADWLRSTTTPATE